MTKDELQQWIKESKLVDSRRHYDENSNCEEWKIYERGGELFRMEFQNGYPYEARNEKGIIQGQYQPRKVIREKEIIEVVRYREPNGND
jgi:hypothetical protein